MALQSQHPTKISTTIFKFWKLCSVQVSSKGPVSISCPGAPAALSAALCRGQEGRQHERDRARVVYSLFKDHTERSLIRTTLQLKAVFDITFWTRILTPTGNGWVLGCGMLSTFLSPTGRQNTNYPSYR